MKPPTTRARWDYLAGPEPTRRESLVTLAGLLVIYGLALAGIAYGLLT